MNYLRILSGKEQALGIYNGIVPCLEHIHHFPDLVEPIYREALTLDEDQLDHLRFGLIRLQMYADIHRNEDLEEAQRVKYVAEMLEKIIYGGLFIEREDGLLAD